MIAARAIVALTVLAGALTLAPEDPRAQASICQRHHSVEACRVW
ncbi:putative conserved membrane protein [Synechococcus sp. A15-28]|nr:putative conserved membrane protein [Synechococcus sp. A15-28]